MLNKEIVKELYIKGYKAIEIAKMLEEKSVNVRKCINRNFKDDKVLHEINRIRDKEILRVTRLEAKNHMSDAEFIKRNRSIYTTNDSGDIVLNRKVSGIVPFDVPTRFSNEFSNDRVKRNIEKSDYRKENLLFT